MDESRGRTEILHRRTIEHLLLIVKGNLEKIMGAFQSLCGPWLDARSDLPTLPRG